MHYPYGCIFQKDREKSQEWFSVLRHTKKPEGKLGKKYNFLNQPEKR